MVDQEQLLLGADAADAGLEQLLVQHLLEGAELGQELLGEAPQLCRVVRLGDSVLAHGSR